MDFLLAILTIIAIVGSFVFKIAYLYPVIASIGLVLLVKLKLEHYTFALLLMTESLIFGILGYGANRIVGLRVGYSDLLLLSLGVIIIIRLGLKKVQITGNGQVMAVFMLWMLIFALGIFAHPEVIEAGLSKFQLMCVDPFLIYIIGISSLRSKEQIRKAILAIALVVIPLAIWTIWHWLFSSFGSGENIIDAEALREATAEIDYMFRNKNLSGALFASLIPLFIGSLVTGKSIIERIVYAIAVIISFAVVISSLSRGSNVSLIIGLSILAMTLGKSRFKVLITSAVLMLVVIGIMNSLGFLDAISQRFETVVDFDRLGLFKSSLLMLTDYPLMGIGMSEASFQEAIYLYSRNDVNLVHPHNSYLQMAVFGGIPLLLTFLGLIFVILRKNVGAYDISLKQQQMRVGISVSIVVFMINMLTDYTYFNSVTCYLFWILLTIYQANAQIDRTADMAENRAL